MQPKMKPSIHQLQETINQIMALILEIKNPNPNDGRFIICEGNKGYFYFS